METKNKTKWGYLREHSSKCDGVDEITGLHRTGLDDYLAVIFPNVTDWLHDKTFGEHNGIKYKIRPDYRSESLKMIIEFDGLPHYTDPEVLIKDENNAKIYKECGYKVIRIPYFIQLSNKAVEKIFNVKVDEELFDISYPSIDGFGVKRNPSFLCYDGVKRMAKEFHDFPEQYEINMKALKDMNNDLLSGASYLETEYNKIVE